VIVRPTREDALDEEYFDLSVVIRPATADRGAIEDDLEKVLQDRQLGEVWGAGAATDGSFCDLSILVSDLDEGVELVREILQRYQVPRSTKLTYHGPELVTYAVYE
jgi:hypothetical protein